jgi:branched-subunit amino acid ABC-type transport system permease component
VDKLLNLVISGSVTGAIYSIMAAGLILTYTTSGIFNFAHGAVAFVTAFFYFELNTGQGIPIVPAVIISVLVFAPLLGLALDYVLLRRLAKAPVYAQIVGTIGLLVALPALALWLVETLGNTVLNLDLPSINAGDAGVSGPGIGPVPAEVFHPIASVSIDSDQLAVLIAAGAAAALLWWVIRKTRAGLEMRAVVDRSELAGLRGVNAGRTSGLAWILTMILAGLGGILITPLFQLNDMLFTLVVLGSLAAVALGGLRSIPIGFLGGLLLGITQNLLAGYGDEFLPKFLTQLSGFRASIPFILTLLLLFLVAARERGRRAGSVAEQAAPSDHRAGLPAWRRRLPWLIFTVVLLAFSLQWVNVGALQADAYEQGTIALGLCMAVIFLSFVVLTGMGGMVSLAQATFVTAGGFAAGWALTRDWGINLPLVATHGRLNFLWGALIAGAVAAALGALIALPLRRLGAVSLALGTLALAFVAQLIPFNTEAIAHAPNGWTLPTPTLDIPVLNDVVALLIKGPQTHLDFSQVPQQIVLLLCLFGIITAMIHALLRSASGRATLAVRSSEVAAQSSGIDVGRTKVRLFALSAGIAGFGGVFLALLNFGSVSNTTATPLAGLFWLALAVTFGIRRPGGALLAGLAFACAPAVFHWIGDDILPGGAASDLLSSTYFTAILFGLSAIQLAKEPDGILALTGKRRLEKRLAKERKRARAERIAAVEVSVHGDVVPEHERLHAPDPDAVTEPEDVQSALALVGIVAGYGEVEVVHDVTLHVPSGSIVALLGANGAGKSTLCSVAAGARATDERHGHAVRPRHHGRTVV